MANIALLNRCNLRCPYCFAQSYTGKEKEDIDLDTFVSLLDFASNDGTVGIIGGEPFLHKDITTFIDILNHDPRFYRVTIFTNGIFLDKALNSLTHPKTELLVNVNSSKDIGKSNFERMAANIRIATELMGKDRVNLGINVYEKNQDFSEFLSLCEDLKTEKIRVSLVIPQNKEDGSIEYFKTMKSTLLKLYKSLFELNISPCYDCNAIPSCVFSSEEMAFLETLPFESQLEREIFLGNRSVCSPVIDLYPDKTATRCFGMYDELRVKIDEFESINDLKNFFFKEIDCRLVNTKSCDKCTNCYKFKTFSCFGGCLCYKERGTGQ